MSRVQASELRDRLRVALNDRLGSSGWEPIDDGHDWSVAVFMRPVGEGLVASFDVMTSGNPGASPVRVLEVTAGVGYEPLRRLWPLLGRYRVAVLTEPVWPELIPDDEDEHEVAEEAHEGRELHTVDDVERLADELARVAAPRVIAFAERYASLEGLLAEVGGAERYQDIRHAALLAAAGRFDEARESLSLLRPAPTEHGWMRGRDRAARQLQRFIESGGDRSLVPREPPPPPYAPLPKVPFAEVWRQARARQQAAAAVRRRGSGKDRAELRAMLERELKDRAASMSPLEIEQGLDHLNDSPHKQAQMLVTGLKTLGSIGLQLVRVLREHRPLPNLSAPAWLRPPARAAWPVPDQHPGRWTEVHTLAESREWLDHAYAAIPRLLGSTARVDAWLSWEPGRRSERRVLVNIGERAVGSLNEHATADYQPVMAAAAERDELPYAPARLTPRPSPAGYLVELQLPL